MPPRKLRNQNSPQPRYDSAFISSKWLRSRRARTNSDALRLYGCGDGVTDTGEECDAYGETNRPNICRNDCTLPRCGDGIVDDAAPYNEECDDGNSINNDGCSTSCKLAKKLQIGIPPAAVKPIVKPGVHQHVPATKQKTPPKLTPYKKRDTHPLKTP